MTCKEKVRGEGRFGAFGYHQCSRNVRKDGFCFQHHPDTVKERQKKATERWNERETNSSWNQLRLAKEKIIELENEIKKIKGKK